MKNKGFTLVELMSVIIILAIVALITVPVVLGIVKDNDRKALEQSVNGLVEGAKIYNARNLNSELQTFDLSDSSVITTLDIKGKLPDEGTLTINADGEISVSAKKGKYCAYKAFNNKKITIESCTELNN
jgi:prepilin-type N-terminal cleavage/methylation domain-containing protein